MISNRQYPALCQSRTLTSEHDEVLRSRITLCVNGVTPSTKAVSRILRELHLVHSNWTLFSDGVQGYLTIDAAARPMLYQPAPRQGRAGSELVSLDPDHPRATPAELDALREAARRGTQSDLWEVHAMRVEAWAHKTKAEEETCWCSPMRLIRRGCSRMPPGASQRLPGSSWELDAELGWVRAP